MSDRNVREFERALVQRIERLERRQRALMLRAWPGAVRTDLDEDTITPSAYDVFFESIGMMVPSGRWIVFADCQLACITTSFPARLWFQAKVVATDSETGEVVDVNCDCPVRYVIQTIDTTIYLPLAVTADVRHDADINIALQTRENSGLKYTIAGPRLKAIPV